MLRPGGDGPERLPDAGKLSDLQCPTGPVINNLCPAKWNSRQNAQAADQIGPGRSATRVLLKTRSIKELPGTRPEARERQPCNSPARMVHGFRSRR